MTPQQEIYLSHAIDDYCKEKNKPKGKIMKRLNIAIKGNIAICKIGNHEIIRFDENGPIYQEN